MAADSGSRTRNRTDLTIRIETFIFEVGESRPSYLLSVNADKCRDTAFSEHMGIDIDAKCIFPEKLVGRTATITLAARRSSLTPEAFKEDSDWIPNCIGALELKGEGREILHGCAPRKFRRARDVTRARPSSLRGPIWTAVEARTLFMFLDATGT